MSVDPPHRSGDEIEPTTGASEPLGDLPRLNRLQVEVRRRLDRAAGMASLVGLLLPDVPVQLGAPDLIWRGSGLARSGVVAQLAWPRLDCRLGLGLDTAVAHALVDRLLGFSGPPADAHRQVTPVEWGILGFVLARALDRLDARPGPLGPWDLVIDRVSADPFDTRDLGPIVTWRWPIRIGVESGSLRLWMPEATLVRLDRAGPPDAEPRPSHPALGSTWRAEAGTITLVRGPGRLKVGAVLPIDGTNLKGTVASPQGPIRLACSDRDGRSWFDAQAIPGASAARITIVSGLAREPTPREPVPVPTTPPNAAPTSPPEIPVTLVVELGRVNLTLARLADLRPGDVVELGRHSREPVELTSNGRLVARGELVQIDTELGVRITNVLL